MLTPLGFFILQALKFYTVNEKYIRNGRVGSNERNFEQHIASLEYYLKQSLSNGPCTGNLMFCRVKSWRCQNRTVCPLYQKFVHLRAKQV